MTNDQYSKKVIDSFTQKLKKKRFCDQCFGDQFDRLLVYTTYICNLVSSIL